MTSVFVDSNVVVYVLAGREPEKRRKAQAWLKRLGPSDLLTLSPQVLNEAYAVLTLKYGLHPVEDGVRATLAHYMRWAEAPLDVNVITAGWSLQDRYGVRIWDALLLASANAAACRYFLSEDLNDGQRYGAVEAINPFRHAPEDVLGRASRP
jgi:predicted nucleic acid-binding protein